MTAITSRPGASEDIIDPATVASLFPGKVAVSVVDSLDLAVPEAALMGAEAAAVVGSRDVRRREFAGGRHAARQALGAIGIPPVAIPVGPDRAPQWPDGVVGSISHTGRACVAVVSRNDELKSLGIDIEDRTPLVGDIVSDIADSAEQVWMREGSEPGERGKVMFCAKEAAYKCLYPVIKRFLDFDAIHIDVADDYAFSVSPAGVLFTEFVSGRVAVSASHVIAAAWIAAAPLD